MRAFKINQTYLYAILTLLLTLLVFHPYLSLYKMPWGDITTHYLPKAYVLKESIFEYKHFFPLWNPYYFSGTPFFPFPSTLTSNYILVFLLLIIPTVELALKLNFLLDVILAGIGMYALMRYLKLEARFAFISAIVYMFNGHLMKAFVWGWAVYLNEYALIPFVILFALKAMREKNWFGYSGYSIITGLLLALQFHGGGGIVLLYTILAFVLLLMIHLIGKNFFKRLQKAFLVGVITAVFCFGFIAVKYLPVQEYLDISSRDFPWEYVHESRRLPLSAAPSVIIEPRFFGKNIADGDQIGVLAFLFALFAIYKKRESRLVWYLTVIIIVALLLASGSFLMYLLWKYAPGWSSMRYLDRALVLYVFSGAVLAGVGASSFFSSLENRFNKKILNSIYFVVVLIIFLELILSYNTVGYGSKMHDVKDMIQQNHIMQYISEQPGIFRMAVWETKGIDYGTEFITVPLKLENIYGYESLWLPLYLNVYLAFANKQPAKFWGILNVKYITAMQQINVTGFRYLQKFEESNNMYDRKGIDKIDGPYLFENERFLPRAFFINKSILIIGKKASVINAMYDIMLNEAFDASKVLLLPGKGTINDYTLNELKKHNVIILTPGTTINEVSKFIAKSYIESGGVILPDIVSGETGLTSEKINSTLRSLEGEITPISDEDIIMYNFDKKEIKLRGKRGFLVVSEKYTLYPGWTAKLDGRRVEMSTANGVVTAVYIPKGAESVVFTYRPKTFMIGLMITTITILVTISYFTIMRKPRFRKKIAPL